MTRDSDKDPQDVDLSSYEVILDVRPRSGDRPSIAGAVPAPMDWLMSDPMAFIPRADARVLLFCDIGMRSAYAASHLGDLGFTDVESLDGGLDEWRRNGLPLIGTAGLTDEQLERFDRQIKLPDIGADGQANLLRSAVAVVGAGGLGSPVVSYLAAAGVGNLRLIDPDIVEVSNLHRQPIYSTSDAGTPKVDAAKRYVAGLNPGTRVDARATALDPTNAPTLLENTDVVVDATDSFAARYAISDAAHSLGIPVVSGAVYRWEGQITTLDPAGPCYRCLFPDAPQTAPYLDCTLVGAVGPVVATVGTMQATEVIKLLTGGASSFTARLGLYDGAAGTLTVVPVSKRALCPTCS